MDKIIIDGVDVSGCGFRHKDTDNQCHIALAFSEDYGECWHCEQIENCYYKQLKRTQNALQEIKTLVTTDYIQNKKQLVQNYDCLDNFMQKIEEKCNEVIL